MERRDVDPEVVRRAVRRSTAESARLARRELPSGFVRSAQAEKFLTERRISR